MKVLVLAESTLVGAGLASLLEGSDRLRVVGDSDGGADVVLVAVDAVTDDTVATVVSLTERCYGTVVLAHDFDDRSLTRLIFAGARGLLREREASTERLSSLVAAAADADVVIPSDLLGRLLDGAGGETSKATAPHWPVAAASEREATVLRLLAEGLDTTEIAAELYYSERTVKAVIHDFVSRHQLRNRTHAVALALREGWI